MGCPLTVLLNWLHPGLASVLSTAAVVLATWAASRAVRRYTELLHCCAVPAASFFGVLISCSAQLRVKRRAAYRL